MHQNNSDQHMSGTIRKPNSTSSSPQNLFQVGSQPEVLGSGFMSMGSASGASHEQK